MNIVLTIFILFSYFQQPSNILKQKKLNLADGSDLLYTVMSPSRIPRNTKVPLVIALHWGWNRNEPIPQWFGKDFLISIVQPAFEEINPVIVAPDCPSENWYNSVSENAVLSLMNHIMNEYPIDSSRIFITGFSAGGLGTWYIAARHPDLFDMAIPMACKPDEEWIQDWKELPVLIIHGTKDEIFPFTEMEKITTELLKQNKTMKLIKIENASHYDTGRFITALQYSHIWLKELGRP